MPNDTTAVYAAHAQAAIVAASPIARVMGREHRPLITCRVTQLQHALRDLTWTQRQRVISVWAMEQGHSVLFDGLPMGEGVSED